jgi:hypothetical protein
LASRQILDVGGSPFDRKPQTQIIFLLRAGVAGAREAHNL